MVCWRGFAPFCHARAAVSASQAKKLPLDHKTSTLVRRLVREHVRPYSGRLMLAVLCMAVVSACTAANAWLMQPVLDEVFVNKNALLLYAVPAAILAIALLKGAASYAEAVLMTFVGQRIVADMQTRMFGHLMRADLAFFHANSTGKLISRFLTDANLLQSGVSTALTGIIKDSLTLAFLVALMFYQDWTLALIAFFVFPIGMLPIVKIGKRMRRVSANTQVQMGEFTTLLDETFQGARHVKAYGMEGYETSRAAAIVNAVFKLQYRASRTRSAARPIMETLAGLAIAAIVLYGGSQVIAGQTTPGTFFSFIAALLLAYQPMKSLANFNANLQEGLAAAQRIFTLLDLEPAIRDAADAKPLQLAHGAVRFDDVQFAYVEGHSALSGLSIDIPAGRTVALVGPSGAGKSTILNLIPRFYDVDSGSVTIDGQDVRAVTVASLRGNISLVSQDITLFDDTVRANIAYGKANATEAEIEAAARTAAAHEFVVELPQGYDTHVGGQGVKLSGGQRQRIAIARAMLKNAPILLLDEATSSLDSESERQVHDALARLMQGRTTVVIAHRLSTVIDADLIYVIDGGRVAESGNHAELLARRGAYARLYALQFAGQRTPEPARAQA